MAGNKAGGRKAAATNRLRHGEDFYARIGAMGGSNGHTGGFFNDPERARIAGAKGGKISRRGPAKAKVDEHKQKIADIRLAELEEDFDD